MEESGWEQLPASHQKPCKEEYSELFQVLIDKENHPPRILFPAKLSFKSEQEIKTSSDKKVEQINLQETCLTKTLRDVFKAEGK